MNFDAPDLGEAPIGNELDGLESGFEIPEIPSPTDTLSTIQPENELEQTNLCEPGPYATSSILAGGPEQTFTEDERIAIDTIGYTSGCHSCGTLDPGTKGGHFVPDHQPPTSLCEDDQPQELYPQCLGCSNQQGGLISAAIR